MFCHLLLLLVILLVIIPFTDEGNSCRNPCCKDADSRSCTLYAQNHLNCSHQQEENYRKMINEIVRDKKIEQNSKETTISVYNRAYGCFVKRTVPYDNGCESCTRCIYIYPDEICQVFCPQSFVESSSAIHTSQDRAHAPPWKGFVMTSDFIHSITPASDVNSTCTTLGCKIKHLIITTISQYIFPLFLFGLGVFCGYCVWPFVLQQCKVKANDSTKKGSTLFCVIIF